MVRAFEITGGADLARIARELRFVADGREIRKRMVREMRREARPLVPLVRRAILSIPTSGKGSTGLRARMARATTLTVRTSRRDAGVTIRVDGRKMPPHERALPAYMEGTKKNWRHPVFGNTDNWVSQPARPYFYRTVKPVGRMARKAVVRVITSITRDIT